MYWGISFFYATVDGEETFQLLAREVLPAIATFDAAPTHPAAV